MRVMTDAEVAAHEARRQLLYTSDWVVDVVTAVLIDSSLGMGLREVAARQKAERILSHLGLDPLARTNRDWTRTDHCATAKGVLAEATT